MENQTVYTKQERVDELCERLPEIANELTGVMQGIKKHMPEVVFSPFIAYYIANGYGEQHEIEKAMHRAIADRLLLDQKNEDDAKYIVRTCRRETQALKLFAYRDTGSYRFIENREKTNAAQIYIRTGAIAIEAEGRALAAPDFRQRLTDYCSVTVESKAEKEAYKQMLAMKEAVQAVSDARRKLAKVMPKAGDAANIEEKEYTEKRILICDDVRLSSESSIARALVNNLLTYREHDKPRYYNTVGVPVYDAAAMYKYFGVRAKANAGLRYLYPDMYKNESFAEKNPQKPTPTPGQPGCYTDRENYAARMRAIESNPSTAEDSPAALEALKELMKEYKQKGIKFHLNAQNGGIVMD